MAVVPQVTLADNDRYLQQIGYLSVISVKGPFSGNAPVSVINQFAVRENAADVQVGDDAYTGNAWGKVSKITVDAIDTTKVESISVVFVHTVKPAGVSNADYVPARTEVYPVSNTPDATNATQDNAYQKLASIGVVFTYQIV
jgi:hypothetical protein